MLKTTFPGFLPSHFFPPPKNKVDYYDAIPSIYYYNGIFSNDLMHVRGDIERYAMIDDDEIGTVRRRIKIGQFYLYKEPELETRTEIKVNTQIESDLETEIQDEGQQQES